MNIPRYVPVAALSALLAAGLIAPLATGETAPGFWVEVLIGGLMTGVLYSLVALGFVLIFKASGVFNFAQGAMVLFAALAVARLAERMPVWAAVIGAVVIMIALAFAVERLVLRPLVNQDAVALLMATLGITFFLNGFGQSIWGSDIYEINLGIPREPMMVLGNVFEGGVLVNSVDNEAAITYVLMVGAHGV
jgi:branched-chain amino acid transport system permease protein